MTPDSLLPGQRNRIDTIDALRGLALVAMTIYHFAWDLEFFGWAPPALTLRPEWIWFARCIAGSFLFLVGVSLVLAHDKGIQWTSFLKRFAMVAAAAALISLVTYFAFPGGFIFFGILHAIALFSLLGVFFVRWHWSVSIGGALLIGSVWWMFDDPIFTEPYLWWVGLAPVAPPSNDYVPLFPWFSLVLTGIAVTKLFSALELGQKITAMRLPNALQRPLGFLGRHSLVYYLIHQPILMGLIWAFTAIAGEPDKTPVFVHQCVQECSRSNTEEFCSPYCSCMADGLQKETLFSAFMDRSLTADGRKKLYTIRDQCVAAQDPNKNK